MTVINIAEKVPMRVIIDEQASTLAKLLLQLLAEDEWQHVSHDTEGTIYAHAGGSRIKLVREG